MAKILRIEFAPLNIPLKRRLQTAAITTLILMLFLGPAIATCAYIYSFFTKYYYISLLYAFWLWYDRKTPFQGGRRCDFIRNMFHFELAKDYFPMKLVKTADIDPNKNYIFGCHPHGFVCSGGFGNLGKVGLSEFPGIRVHGVTLSLHFFWPILRELLLFLGVCSASKKSIYYLLNKCGKGMAIVLFPGGSAEVMEAHPHTAVLLLKNRKGFVRLAIENGVPLVPVYTFGETDMYYQLSNPDGSLVRKIQTQFKDIFKIPLYLINGRGIFQYTFGILPRRHPIITVVGKPLEVEKHDNPTEEMVNKCHARYVEALQQLFDEYKVKLGGDFKDQVLVIK